MIGNVKVPSFTGSLRPFFLNKTRSLPLLIHHPPTALATHECWYHFSFSSNLGLGRYALGARQGSGRRFAAATEITI